MIDRRLVHALGAWPEIMSVLVLRSVARAQALAVSLAISCMTGLKLRLVVLMWHLADRWGRVGTEGVSIPLQLTHRTVGRLVGASRPSVSTALKELEREGVITPRERGGSILHGEPPPELASLHDRRAARRRRASSCVGPIGRIPRRFSGRTRRGTGGCRAAYLDAASLGSLAQRSSACRSRRDTFIREKPIRSPISLG